MLWPMPMSVSLREDASKNELVYVIQQLNNREVYGLYIIIIDMTKPHKRLGGAKIK